MSGKLALGLTGHMAFNYATVPEKILFNFNQGIMMKHLRWLSIGAALFFCLGMLAPMDANAASTSKKHANVKTQVKKASHKKTSTKSKKVKKMAAKSGVAKFAETQAKESSNSREKWIKHAQEGDMLTGKASWFGKDFHNKITASGLDYDMYTFTAAHRTLPLGTVVKVTDATNGKSVMVCVTDRGPYVKGRIIDLSYAAAQKLDLSKRGVGSVKLEVVSDEEGAPLKSGQAYFIKYAAGEDKKKVGPFKAFADAAAMREALSQAHPEAEVILEKDK